MNACKLRKHNWRLSPIPDERSAQVAMCDVAPPMLGQARNSTTYIGSRRPAPTRATHMPIEVPAIAERATCSC